MFMAKSYLATGEKGLKFLSGARKKSDFLILDPKATWMRTNGQNAKKKQNDSMNDYANTSVEAAILAEELRSSKDTGYLQSLANMRPTNSKLSPLRFDELRQSILKGYTKSQLVEYLNSNAALSSHRSLKRDLVEQILTQFWKLSIGNTEAGHGSYERSIHMRPRSFYLLMSDHGSRVREWIKAGAKVWIEAEKHELVVSANHEIQSWIDAKISQFESEIIFETIDTAIPVSDFGATALRRIQRDSQTFFVTNSDLGSHTIVAYANSLGSMNLCKKLLKAFQTSDHLQEHFFYDTNVSNIDKYRMMPVDDPDYEVWNLKECRWMRWDIPKARSENVSQANSDMKPL